jgi:hypothetical protein
MYAETRVAAGIRLTSILTVALLLGSLVEAGAATVSPPSGNASEGGPYFAIQVVDRQTGRGVPLVELRTVNNIRLYTDSNGLVAFNEPGLMDTDVFFFVESHGYEFPKDGFGYRGTRLKTKPGGSAVIRIDRINIAERLYRVTGQGIYRDSVLTGRPVPLEAPVLNGQVMGQDSVDTCIYHGQLYWFWGDTGRPSYPLGHFALAAAVSDLPGRGGLDPAVGVNLEYFVDENGFSRPVCRLKEPGLVWPDGFVVVKDNEGRERIVAKYARLKDLGTVLERGLVVFNDDTESFEPLLRSGIECLPYSNSGHALHVAVAGREYFYFATPFPLAVRMRVRARWDDVIDPNHYEAFTALKTSGTDTTCRWISFDDLTGGAASAKTSTIEALKKEKEATHLYDVATGQSITPHGGSVHFNAYRQRWVSIFVQHFGESSLLGEVWYAEADTPVGPWAYARKVATHNKYSFYNPMHHSYFDQDGGRVIFFEGTYSHTFSGSAETATPRYDYNQIMYRLSLDDPRLVLPVAVYQVRGERERQVYLLREAVERANAWDRVESVPFYAVKPDRASPSLVPIYATDAGFSAEPPEPSASPLFCALPASSEAGDNACVVPLFEHGQANPGRLSSAEPQPLCWVWKAPDGPLLLDRDAEPAGN